MQLLKSGMRPGFLIAHGVARQRRRKHEKLDSLRCRYQGNSDIDVSHHFLEESLAAISWDNGEMGRFMESLLNFPSEHALEIALREGWPRHFSPSHPRQLWQFSRCISERDIIVTNPSPKETRSVRVGFCTKGYFFEVGRIKGQRTPRSRVFNFPHLVKVEWSQESITHHRLPGQLARKLQLRGRTVEDISEYTQELERLLGG